MSYFLDKDGFARVEFEVVRTPPQLSLFIYKVLKQVHPGTGISKKSMKIVETIIQDLFTKIAEEAGRLARYNKCYTITEKEIQTAIRLVLPVELAKHAVSEGVKAVEKYNESVHLLEN